MDTIRCVRVNLQWFVNVVKFYHKYMTLLDTNSKNIETIAHVYVLCCKKCDTSHYN